MGISFKRTVTTREVPAAEALELQRGEQERRSRLFRFPRLPRLRFGASVSTRAERAEDQPPSS